LSLQSPQREPLRARLVTHLLGHSAAVLDTADYNAVVEQFAQITGLYTPREIADGMLPAGLEPVARFLVDHGSPRGDEARVLSALLVLRGIHANDRGPADLYRRIKEWGFDARDALNSPLGRFEEGLVEVWEEHARLTPTSEVLAAVARLYVERRNSLLAAYSQGERRVPLSQAVFEASNDTAFQLAAVYLQHGDIASAITQLGALGSTGGVEDQLLQVLKAANEPDSEGTAALLYLARYYLRQNRPEVARGVCLLGLRAVPEDARFSHCLAGVATAQSDFLGAMAWYAEAVRLMPDNLALYDETLSVLSGLIERGLFGEDPAQTRALGTRATEILHERMRRWPGSPPPIKPEELYLAVAVSEMNAGNASEAEASLRASLAAQSTLPGLLQLGLLLERTSRTQEAAEVYRTALSSVSSARGDADLHRADVLEHLGDVLRMLGQTTEAAKDYEQALTLWTDHVSAHGDNRSATAQLRRGILLGRLGKSTESVEAFTQAMERAPAARETYATILAYLAVSDPNTGFANQVFHNAITQISLEPEWKVYFALWIRIIASRTGAPLDGGVLEVFADLAQGKGWWARLAQHGSDQLAFQALFDAATGLGQRTEAYFYEGARRLRVQDVAGAREMFERVLQSNMVNFYEFAMAQQFIAQTSPAPMPPAVHTP
jgi:tetratricopeptide (TPR) repeat protein